MIENEVGTVTFRRRGGEIEYLILFTAKSKYWEFPKGHIEPGETEEQALHRELLEETGLRGTIVRGFSHRFTLHLPGKECIFNNMLVEVDPGEICLEPTHESFRFVSYEEALRLFSFDNLKELLKAAHSHLESLRE